MPNPFFIRSFRSHPLIPLLCLFFSGAASLAYELIWVKQLTLVFGATQYAISAVLCAFMTGLGLGAWSIGQWLRRQNFSAGTLVRLYGGLEGCIGLYGLLFPWLLDSTSAIYPILLSASGSSESSLHVMEFIWGTALMLPSTFMMGATLPVLGSWAVADRADRLLPNVSLLYGLNTLGAMAGCLGTQFSGVRLLGVTGMSQLAAGVNLAIAAACFFWKPEKESPGFGMESSPKEEAASTSPVPTGLGWALVALFGFSGFAALSGEILWTRILVFPLQSSLYSFALILATFLFGIALGSLAAGPLFRGRDTIRSFILLEIIIGILGLSLIAGLDHVQELTAWLDARFYNLNNSALATLLRRSAVAVCLLFLPTFCFGLAFPLANQVHVHLFKKIPSTLGNSYGINTLGAILGTVLTPFLLIPTLGISRSLFLVFGCLLVLAAVSDLLDTRSPKRRKPLAFICGALLVPFWVGLNPGVDTRQPGKGNLARLDFTIPPEQLQLKDYKEGNFSTLSVYEDTRRKTRTLYVDGFSTATVSEKFGGTSYMQAMGWLPMMLHPNPNQALVMCFGTGNTLGTVALFPEVKVDAVELDRNVLSMAHWFSKWNREVLQKPNVSVHVQDARQFIRWNDSFYDVITLEPMHPAFAGVTHLYSREFYQFARKRLNPGGLMMQWLPLHLVSREDAFSIIKTFQEVFPHVAVWNSFLTRIVLLTGSEQPLSLDPSLFFQRMQHPEVSAAGREMGVKSFLDFSDLYLTDARSLEKLLEESPVITDDHPLLEHSSVTLLPPFSHQTDETFLNFLLRRAGQVPPVTGLTAIQASEFQKALDQRTARRLSIFSQRYNGPGKEAFARKQYFKGMAAVNEFWKRQDGEPVCVDKTGWKSNCATPE